MSLVISTNSTATQSRNYLAANQVNLQRSLGRLASGSRIVRPSDDAGGLAVGNKITATVNRNVRTQQNVSNAISFLQVQDGALSSVGKILDRMSELKTMSLDVTKNALDIANYDAEFNQLQDQLSNVRQEKFNGINLFTTTAATPSPLSAYTTEVGDGAGGPTVSLTRLSVFTDAAGAGLNTAAGVDLTDSSQAAVVQVVILQATVSMTLRVLSRTQLLPEPTMVQKCPVWKPLSDSWLPTRPTLRLLVAA